MRRRDDGQITAERVFHQLVEVVGMIVRQQDDVDRRKLVQVDGRVRAASACDARSDCNMLGAPLGCQEAAGRLAMPLAYFRHQR